MATYTYKCKNTACEVDLFQVTCSVHDKVDAYACPVCRETTAARSYEPVTRTYKITKPSDVQGVYHLERDYEKQVQQANHIADHAYEHRAHQGYTAWRDGGGEDDLMNALASVTDKPEKQRIFSGGGGK